MHSTSNGKQNFPWTMALLACVVATACGDRDATERPSQALPSDAGTPSPVVALPLPALADEALHSTLHSLGQELVHDAMNGSSHSTTQRQANPSSRTLIGLWRTKHFEQGAWVDLIWVMGKRHAWHVVTAYADEQLTVPLVRWDIVRHYTTEPSPAPRSERHHLVWTDLASWITPYVNNPQLFEQIGLDDCGLVAGVQRDVSTDNCGAPLFPFRHCPLLDFVEVVNDRMTFGDPRQGDRCEQRPTRYEAWSFERVRPTHDLVRRLAGT